MTTFTGGFTTPGTSAEVNLVLEVNVASQSIELNQSSLSWSLYMVEYVNASPFRGYNDCVAAASVGGSVYYATNLNYNFDGTNETIAIASGSKTIAHASDGTATISVSASYDGKTPLGTASLSSSLALPTIPRNRAAVGVDDAWEVCEVFVGINNAWVPARPYAGDSGVWKELDVA